MVSYNKLSFETMTWIFEIFWLLKSLWYWSFYAEKFCEKGFIYDQKKSSSISFLRHFISRSFVNSELKYYFLNRIACWHRCWWRTLVKKWVTVMLVISLCWRLYDGDWFQILVAESLCWRPFFLCWRFSQCVKSVTNIVIRSPTS